MRAGRFMRSSWARMSCAPAKCRSSRCASPASSGASRAAASPRRWGTRHAARYRGTGTGRRAQGVVEPARHAGARHALGSGAGARRLAGVALVRDEPGRRGERALRVAFEGGAGRGRQGDARRRGHARRSLPAHALRLDGGAGCGALPLRPRRPEERQGPARVGDRALAVGGLQGPRAPAPRRGAARREGLRPGAEAARFAARSGLRRAVRGAERRHPGGEPAARRGESGVPPRAGEIRAEGSGLLRERAHASRGARGLTMRVLLSMLAVPLAGACSSSAPMQLIRGGPSGPKPAPLPELARPQAVRALWSSSVGGADRFVFSPALAGDSVYATSRGGEVARLDAATGQAAWRVTLARG